MEVKNKKRYYNTSYVDGSAVRKLQPMPDVRREEQSEIIRKTAPKPTKKHKQVRKPAMSFFSFVMLTASIVVTLYAAVQYLQVQTELATMNKEVASLQNKLIILTSENDADLNKINSTLDLEKVFDVAVGELGMVFPNDNKIITYEGAINEYVRQFDKIPETSATDLLEKFRK